MPIECVLLKDRPTLKVCPACGARSFRPFLRGQVQRRKHRFLWWGRQPYCAVICEDCKEIVGHESPGVFDEIDG